MPRIAAAALIVSAILVFYLGILPCVILDSPAFDRDDLLVLERISKVTAELAEIAETSPILRVLRARRLIVQRAEWLKPLQRLGEDLLV